MDYISKYIDMQFDAEVFALSKLSEQFETVFCVPAYSAQIEQVSL